MAIKYLRQFAQQTGLVIDEQRQAAYGWYHDYQLVLTDAQTQYAVVMSVNSYERGSDESLFQFLNGLMMENKSVRQANNNRGVVSIIIAQSRPDANLLTDILNSIADFFRSNGLVSCCKHCGKQTGLAVYSLSGLCEAMCSQCFETKSNDIAQTQSQQPVQKSNMPLGIAGALAGSLIGVALWVIIFQFGYIVGVVGFAIMFFCMKGYQLTSGKMTKPGFFICMFISIIMLFAAEYIALAVVLYRAFSAYPGVGFLEALLYVPDALIEGEYLYEAIIDIVLGLVFIVIGSISFIRSTFRSLSTQGEMLRLM